jgi:hypothetical protein
MTDIRNLYKISGGNFTGRDHLGAIRVTGKIFKLILKKKNVIVWIGLIWLGIGYGRLL